jgi:hypothetical protein
LNDGGRSEGHVNERVEMSAQKASEVGRKGMDVE